MAITRRWWSSLSHPLLLSICALLAIVVIAVTAWSYTEIRHALTSQMMARVEGGAREIEDVFAWLLVRLVSVGVAILLLGIVGASWISWRFAGAFNVMAERVEVARRELETRVVQRTADLERALQQLHDTQDELVRNEKLATLGQLAGGVGHELRNPVGVMTNVVFYLEMVLENAPPDVREYLGILRHQIHLSEKIISDLLDFSRNRTPVTEAVRLEHLAETQLSRTPRVAEVVRDFDANVPAARVDPVHAGQVLHNLLENATQAMGEAGGTLTLRTRRHDASHVRIEVADTGPGVPAELRERIFEPLFTTKARGIGLGLAVSRQLAAMNGGELRLASPPGDGATFWFVLPAATAS